MCDFRAETNACLINSVYVLYSWKHGVEAYTDRPYVPDPCLHAV